VENFFNPELVVPDDRAGLADGAIVPWTGGHSPYYDQTLQSLARHYKQTTKTAWRELPDNVRHAILFGSDEPIAFNYKDGVRGYQDTQTQIQAPRMEEDHS
jgi:excinuclease ABC subunit A